MDNTSVTITITVIVILAIGITVWGTAGNQTNDDVPPQATTTQATSSDDIATSSTGEQDSWSDTTLAGIRFSYPPKAEVSVEAGRAKVQILGPGNEPNTEVTDGITGYLYRVEGQNGLSETAESIFSDTTETAQAVIASTTETVFADQNGYAFTIENQLGSETSYYVFSSDQPGNVLVASYTASGPNAERFISQFEAITQTARVVEGVNDSDITGNEQATTNAQACQDAGGNWLAQYSECEGVTQSWCDKRSGQYDDCASACRHNPEAQGCADVCVRACSFSSR